MGRVPKPTSPLEPSRRGERESVLGRGSEGLEAANVAPFLSPGHLEGRSETSPFLKPCVRVRSVDALNGVP